MLDLLLFSFLSIFIITPLGYFFINNDNKNFLNYSVNLIFGFILISFISLFLNFFFPLNKILNTLILFVPIIIILKKPSYFFTLNFFLFAIVNAFLIFLLITKSNVYRPDAFLYHIPFIDILNQNKIIIGLTNLHFRFGHISIIQYSSAILNNFIFFQKGIFLAISIIASAIIINFLSHIILYVKDKNFNFHFFYLFFIIIFISYKMNRYGEYGNDAPAHFLFFFLISELIQNFNKKYNNLSNLILLSVFIVMNKITMAFSIFLPFLFLKKFPKNIFIEKKNYFIAFFLFLWFLKNIINSGCLIYPVSKLCFENLSWTNINLAKKVAIENEAWAKGWNELKDPNNFNQKKYSENFNWVKTWAKGHLIKINKILLPYLIFILLILLYLYFHSKENKINKKNKSEILLLITALIIFIIVWLIKVPVFRFGYSYLISCISVIFAFVCSGWNNKSKFFFIGILIFCITIFTGKNFIRIINLNGKFNSNVWPKVILFNSSSELNKVKLDYFEYFEAPSECGSGFSPCTNYRNLNLLSIKYYTYICLIKNKSDI